jgi:hypothetical protein
MAESKYPAIYIIAYTVFYGSIIIIFFEAFRVSNVPPLFLLIGAILILFDFIQKMEFNPIHSNKNFISLDGVIGVVDSPLMPLHGGRSKLVVTVKKRYAPEGWFRNGFQGFMTSFAGAVQVPIKDHTEKFREIPIQSCGAPEGAIFYLGSISGKPLDDNYTYLMQKLDSTLSQLRAVESVYESNKELTNQLARGNNLDMIEANQKLAIILRELSEPFKPQNPIRPREGDR